MSYFIKTTRDTLTGQTHVSPPQEAPNELQPYRLRYGRHTAECVQVFPSRFEAANAYADELLYASYVKLSQEERQTELKKLTKNLKKIKCDLLQIGYLTDTPPSTIEAYRAGRRTVNPRLLARVRLLHDGMMSFVSEYTKRLPPEGDCGNTSMSRGGNPEIHKFASRR